MRSGERGSSAKPTVHDTLFKPAPLLRFTV